MFSVAEKQRIAAAVEQVIREINHPEVDPADVKFWLHIEGRGTWSFANIHPNSQTLSGPPNPWNERARSQTPVAAEEGQWADYEPEDEHAG
jgi:hypothetical protein